MPRPKGSRLPMQVWLDDNVVVNPNEGSVYNG